METDIILVLGPSRVNEHPIFSERNVVVPNIHLIVSTFHLTNIKYLHDFLRFLIILFSK